MVTMKDFHAQCLVATSIPELVTLSGLKESSVTQKRNKLRKQLKAKGLDLPEYKRGGGKGGRPSTEYTKEEAEAVIAAANAKSAPPADPAPPADGAPQTEGETAPQTEQNAG